MRIALTQEDFRPSKGGAEIVALNHARMLIDAGHEVDVYTMAHDDLPPGVRAHRLQAGRWMRKTGFARAVKRTLEGEAGRFDVVHGFGRSLGMDLLQPGGGLHRAYLEYEARMHSPGSRPWLRFWRGLSPVHRAILAVERQQYPPGESGPRYVALSNMVRRHMRECYAVPESRIHQIYLGVDLERYHPRAREAYRDLVRRRHGIPADAPVLLFVAHNFRLKGLSPLLRAMSMLDRGGKPVWLVVVGRGKQGAFARLAEKLGVGKRTVFAGPSKHTEQYYGAADLFVHPSFYDPCATVVFEALAAGLPVVTSVHNGSGEILERDANGRLIDPEKPEELAEAVAFFLDPDRLQSASISARRLAEKYPVARYFNGILDVYRLIVSAKA